MKGKDIINVRKSSIEADFPIGQKLSINGINCVVANEGLVQIVLYVFQTFIAMTSR